MDILDAIAYNPVTGIFIWKISPRYGIEPGDIAGSVCDKGYIQIKYKQKVYKAHRLTFLFMTGKYPTKHIDHKNTIRQDNSWGNLRESNQRQNNENRGMRSDNTSGIKGVSWSIPHKKWLVQIQVKGIKLYLGLYEDLELAELVISEARNKYHGSFANHGVRNA